jgi:predicted MPP superfamily phosphohydrolase
MDPAAPGDRAPPARPRLPARLVRRIVTGLLGWTTSCWLVIGALVHRHLPGGWAAIAGAVVVATAPLLVLIRTIGRSGYPPRWVRLFVFRPFWYLQLLTPLVAIAGVVGVLVGLPFGSSGSAGRIAIGGTTPVLIWLAIWGYLGAQRLTVRRLRVPVAGLPTGLAGLTICQLSDLHVGPHTSRGYLTRIAAAVEAARPDLIALTGDQVDDFARDVEPFARAFGRLSAPLGVIAVAGNHDVYAGWSEVRHGLEAMGVTVLVNRAIRLERGGAGFWVTGTGDPAGLMGGPAAAAAPDIDRTLAQVPPGAIVVALAHNPVLWPALADRGVAVTLSGHTHHGQLSIPALGWSLVTPFAEFAMGEYRRGSAWLYVSPGTNYWGIPFRIGALPEVTLVTLEPATS